MISPPPFAQSCRGTFTPNADIAKGTWFRVGGAAEYLFQPADINDLSEFLKSCPTDIPITLLGLGSNVIIRDGGVRGFVIKLGKNFADIIHDNKGIITVGAGTSDVIVAKYAATYGLGGLEFLVGIPGNIGGALRMNAGAYGTEISDILIDAQIMQRDGTIQTIAANDMGFSYRHNGLSDDVIFLSARLKTFPEQSDIITAKLEDIKKQRAETQPVKDRTGGSTFANPEGHKAWQLIDAVGGRGFEIGGAKISEKHCNFMLNPGNATAADLENLGEEMRRRVKEKFNIELQWEIKRIGEKI
jgi:UDP-N-acetylmuramate dehydrogenase